MATGKKPPREAGVKPSLRATNFKVLNGQQERGYKAGAIHGVVGHRTHALQPCVRNYTDGALQCPYCTAGLVPEWRGYTPIWDRDYTLRYALIGWEFLETVDIIPVRAQVTLTRAKNPISPLVIRQETCLLRELPNKEPWSAEVNMEDICLLLWQNPELTKWVLEQRATVKVHPAAIAVDKNGEPRGAMMQGAFKSLPGEKVVEPSELDYEKLKNRLIARAQGSKPSKNGKHTE